jgi:molecular chaperone DnaK (HSP70)
VTKNVVINKINYELENVNGKPTVKVNFNDRTVNLFPEQVSALLLSYLKTIAEGFLNLILTLSIIYQILNTEEVFSNETSLF